MPLNTRPILTAIVDHALVTGLFETVNRHETVSPPGHGLHAEVWRETTEPASRASGLVATSVRLVFTLRIKTSAIAEPRDEIDPMMDDAVDALMNAYTGDFTLGGLVRNVDLLGAHGIPLRSRAGYLPPGSAGEAQQRVVDITIPVIKNDVWNQEA